MAEIHQFVYPAVFVQGEAEVVASFPDLGITTEGESFEEAFLFAKDFLRVYCSYALKFDLDINKPSFFTEIVEQFKNEKLDYSLTFIQSREIHFSKHEKKLRYEFLKNSLTDMLDK